MSALVNISGMIDRFLFSIGMILTIIFVVLKFMNKLDWAWYWILSPFWIWFILSFVRMRTIVKPSIGKLTGIEGKVKWSRAKKIEVKGPDFFGHYHVYVDSGFNVAIFLPKSDRTLHVFIGDILRAHKWIKCDQTGEKINNETPPEQAFEWKINPKNIWYRGTGFPPGKPNYRGKVISSEDFFDEINQEWIDLKIKEQIQMMAST